ncbi:MAG: hypothetical protein K2X00_17620 [Nitrospiraceae bacterium]|nr:hypothetical protein [Nitrospiraceae bacterium]
MRLERDIAIRAATAVSPLNLFKYFKGDQVALRAEIARLEARRAVAVKDRDSRDAELRATDRTIADLAKRLADYRAFDPDDARAQLNALVVRIREGNRQAEALDRELSGLELRCGKQIEAFRTAAATIETLEATIQAAKTMDDELSGAGNGYERAMIHEDCERRYGHGSPKKVIHETSGQLRRIRGDLQKIEKRLKECLRVSDLHVERVVIDGNNACYRGGDFIRLMAVTRIVDALAKEFAVTVVFDASIRRLLQMDDTMIRSVIGDAAQTFVAPSKTAADRFALEIAGENDRTFVLSNDRFSEFADFAPVAENRLIRFLIASEHVSIPDLDRVIPLPTGGQ